MLYCVHCKTHTKDWEIVMKKRYEIVVACPVCGYIKGYRSNLSMNPYKITFHK